MLFYPKTVTLVIGSLAVANVANGFTNSPTPSFSVTSRIKAQSTLLPSPSSSSTTKLFGSIEEQSEKDNEIERLKQMAAKLRADVAQLELERQEQLSQAVEKAFKKFDINADGEISFEELKTGLEKELKQELSEKRVQKLMADFDTTGDGTLKLEEFVTIDQFRNRLQQLSEEEKRLEREAIAEAKREKDTEKLMQATLELINDNAPTAKDRFISILPYLFPLLDGVQFGKYILLENADNPFVAIIAIIYALYRSVPFSGLIAFFALNFLSGNLSLNRLIRFNMQQAIFLDIALFFPGLIGALFGILSGGVQVPQIADVLYSDTIFFVMLAVVGYAAVSSILGITPDKIPLISDAVSQRMPTIEMLDSNQIQIIQKRDKKKDKDDEKNKDEKKD